MGFVDDNHALATGVIVGLLIKGYANGDVPNVSVMPILRDKFGIYQNYIDVAFLHKDGRQSYYRVTTTPVAPSDEEIESYINHQKGQS